jgi:hydrogenase maturation protein HypF
MLLTRSAGIALEKANFQVLTHRQTPPNDGCIALGQAMIANQQLK